MGYHDHRGIVGDGLCQVEGFPSQVGKLSTGCSASPGAVDGNDGVSA